MTVIAQTQKYQIEPGGNCVLGWREKISKHLAVGRCDFRRTMHIGRHRKYIRGRKRNPCEEDSSHHAKIATRIFCGNKSFVAKKEIRMRPVDLRRPICLGK